MPKFMLAVGRGLGLRGPGRRSQAVGPVTDAPSRRPARAGSRLELTHAAGLRAFDLLVCVLLVPVALPVWLITAFLIFVDSPGAVTFKSIRVGKDGREFGMLKFRKMRNTARGGPLTLADDQRFTPIGRFLALTKLDELPQLWNVVRGDMRIVGPRPEVPEFVARYRDLYDEILTVKPGITGPAALEYASESHLLATQTDPHRFYVEELMPRKIEIDTEYVRRRTLVGDVRIVLSTTLVPIAKVLRTSLHDPRVRRVEAVLVLASGLILGVVFVLAGSPS